MLWCWTGLSNTPSYIKVASQRSGPIMKVETLVMPIWKASSMRSACKRMYSPRGRISSLGTVTSASASSCSSLAIRTSTLRIMVMNSSMVDLSSLDNFFERDLASAKTKSETSDMWARKLPLENNLSYSFLGSLIEGAILPGPYHEILSNSIGSLGARNPLQLISKVFKIVLWPTLSPMIWSRLRPLGCLMPCSVACAGERLVK